MNLYHLLQSMAAFLCNILLHSIIKILVHHKREQCSTLAKETQRNYSLPLSNPLCFWYVLYIKEVRSWTKRIKKGMPLPFRSGVGQIETMATEAPRQEAFPLTSHQCHWSGPYALAVTSDRSNTLAKVGGWGGVKGCNEHNFTICVKLGLPRCTVSCYNRCKISSGLACKHVFCGIGLILRVKNKHSLYGSHHQI